MHFTVIQTRNRSQSSGVGYPLAQNFHIEFVKTHRSQRSWRASGPLDILARYALDDLHVKEKGAKFIPFYVYIAF